MIPRINAKEIDQGAFDLIRSTWREYASRHDEIEMEMEEILQGLVGRLVLFQVGNMVGPAEGEVLDVTWDRIRLKNVMSGKTRWIIAEAVFSVVEFNKIRNESFAAYRKRMKK